METVAVAPEEFTEKFGTKADLYNILVYDSKYFLKL